MDFIYDTGKLSEHLGQGDVLRRTREVVGVLSQAHSYYAEAADYSYFVVLTQSCDLVRRKGGRFSAPYITIAAARPADAFIAARVSELRKSVDGTGINVLSPQGLVKLRFILENLLHNTLDEVFYLPESEAAGIEQDLCVYLHLSIALRKEHYDALLGARVTSLAEVFRAKLGWLKGNIYSRIATPAIEERLEGSARFKEAFFERKVPSDSHLILSNLQNDFVRSEVKRMLRDRVGPLSSEEEEKLAQQIPSDATIVSEEIVATLARRGYIDGDDPDRLSKIKSLIQNARSLRVLAGGA